MDFKEAKKIRGQSLSGNITNRLVGGDSIGSSIKSAVSEKFKAKVTGVKEAFHPMNIAKKLTGGSKLASAIVGKMTGASPESMQYFAGGGQETASRSNGSSGGLDSQTIDLATTALLAILHALQKQDASDTLDAEQAKERHEQEQSELDKRNQELIKALTARTPRGKTRTEKKAERRKERKAEKAEEEPAKAPSKTTETKKTTTKETIKEVKETPKAPEAKPKVETPKAEAPKAEAPKSPEAKPSPKEMPTSKAEKITKAATLTLAAGAGVVASSLAEAGITGKAQANILAQIDAESKFQPKSENLNYKSAQRIQDVFGKKRIPDLAFAEKLVNNPEALANVVYANTDGNSAPGDGWKYRGRGFLQHTGKNQYIAIAKYTGIDVVSNPDLLNDPKVAAKAVPWFFLVYKHKKPKQLENISEVNSAVGFAGGKAEADHRSSLVSKYENMASPASPVSATDTGPKLNQASVENKDMKVAMNDSSSTNNTNNQTVNNQANVTESPNINKPNDKNPYQRKRAGA